MADINVTMTGGAGVTLATKGKYCPENVKVTPALQEKSVTPTAFEQSITPEPGKAGLSKVIVAAIPDNYGLIAFNGVWLTIT